MDSCNLLEKRLSQHEDPTQRDKIRQDKIRADKIRADKIRAFNSIVSILAQIQVDPPFKGGDIPDAKAADSHERLQLKLSNAFAHLAITNVEVAAATMYTPGRLFVLTWMQDQHPDGQGKDKAGAAQDPQKSSFWESLFLMFATNTSFDDLSPKTSTYPGPCIVGAAPPPDYPNASDSKQNMLDYLAQLPKKWTAPKESSHLWVLANILSTFKCEDTLLTHVMTYTIAASHPKIQRRFKTLLSRGLLHCFETMPPKQVSLSFQLISPHYLAQRARFQSEIDNDRELLELLESCDAVVPNYKTNYPKIVEIASNLKHPESDPELFNHATCKEYHGLFRHLIAQYRNTVDKISKLAKEKVSFEDELDLAVNTGHMLLTMVKGKAFHMYLVSIEPILVRLYNDYRISTESLRLSAKARQMQSANKRNADEREADQRDADKREADQRDADKREADQRDADEREIESGSTLCPPTRADDGVISWQKVQSWIMLILVQLDAADALCEFIKQPELTQAEIDVKLAYSPLVSNEAISLEELLLGGYIPEPEGAEKTNAELLDIVKAANVRREQLEKLDALINHWGKGRFAETRSLIAAVLNQATDEDRQAGHGNGGDSPNAIISALCASITDVLNRKPLDLPALHRELSALSEQLKERQPLSFSERKEFTGTLHCEAGLASILDQSTRSIIQGRIEQLNAGDLKDEQLHCCLSELLEQSQGFTRVIGVSKRCCPVCRRLLAYLSLDGNRTTGFVTPGFHNTITKCTLPEWTPEPIVDNMNRTFGQLLRTELVNLLRDAAIQEPRQRRQSSGSGVSIGNKSSKVGKLIRTTK